MSTRWQFFFGGIATIVVGIVLLSWMPVPGVVLTLLGMIGIEESIFIPHGKDVSVETAFKWVLGGLIFGIVAQVIATYFLS